MPQLKIDKQQVQVMHGLLSDLPIEKILSGVSIFCASHKEIYPNTNIVAYIREYALYDPKELTSAEAWEVVRKAIASYGRYSKRPKFESLIEKSVESIGWVQLCDSNNPSADRAHFMRMYDTFVGREKMNKMRGLSTDIDQKLLIGG